MKQGENSISTRSTQSESLLFLHKSIIQNMSVLVLNGISILLFVNDFLSTLYYLLKYVNQSFWQDCIVLIAGN